MKKICAVVVTYNRKELLIRNIESLLRQTYPLDILIYDNASTDGTYGFLKEKGFIDRNNIFYIKSDKNLGGAGGFCNGEKEAIKRGYDFLWLMDDDGYCINENTLSELLIHYDKDKKRIINSYVICNTTTNELTFDLGPYCTDDEVKKASNNGIVFGYGNPYNGTLVPKDCFFEIGFTDERMFIYGDENDFRIRSQKAGYEWITPINSLYYHPINRNINKYNFLGYKYDTKDQPIWKFYLEYRNDRYLQVRHYNKTNFFNSLKVRVRMILSALHSSDKKFKRLRWGWIAVHDGERQYFDRPIPFNE